MSQHARLSASKSERFINCPGSVALEELLPPEEASEFAEEGTAAHKLAEICLKDGSDAWEHDGEDLGGGFSVTPEMAEHVQTYLDFVRTEADGFELHVEYRIENPELGEDFGGTADVVVSNIVPATKSSPAGGFLVVADLKYGAGLAVEVVGNTQLLYYPFGVLKSLGVKRGKNTVNVQLAIIQPRAPHTDGPIRSVWMKADDILAWGEDVLLPAMKKVNETPGEFKDGEHCFFCPARLVCPLVKGNYDAMAEESSKPLENLTSDKLAEQYEKLTAVRRYIKALEDECYKRAMNCDPVPGTKLIYGRSSREWKEDIEELAALEFGEDAYTDPVLKSPAQIEKLPGGKDFAASNSFKKEGRPTLVPSDKSGVVYDPRDAGAGFASIGVDKEE